MKTLTSIQLPIIFFGLCFCFLGCATVNTTPTGKSFNSAKVKQIIKEKTTADEIVSMFGAPFTKQPDADGGEEWEYYSGITTTKGQGSTFGGILASGFASFLSPAAGAMVYSANEQPKNTFHNKELDVKLNKQRIVVDFSLNNDKAVNDPQKSLQNEKKIMDAEMNQLFPEGMTNNAASP
jgi:outer membrane protein assembly factor BamE (lipoprotein component of BamABCDE complex)